MEVSKNSLMTMAILTLIISGSFVVFILPEAMSFECLTPDDVWYEDGAKQVGYMVNCD
jgi:hypothetical protein